MEVRRRGAARLVTPVGTCPVLAWLFVPAKSCFLVKEANLRSHLKIASLCLTPVLGSPSRAQKIWKHKSRICVPTPLEEVQEGKGAWWRPMERWEDRRTDCPTSCWSQLAGIPQGQSCVYFVFRYSFYFYLRGV